VTSFEQFLVHTFDTSFFYFLGESGITGDEGCGHGGASTLVFAMSGGCGLVEGNCDIDDVVLIAGGGGGGAGGFGTTGADGAAGGVAPATVANAESVTGAGQNNFSACAQCNAQGGSEPGQGLGGDNLLTSNANGFDGIGGEGGWSLQKCEVGDCEICCDANPTGWGNGDPKVGSNGRGGVSDCPGLPQQCSEVNETCFFISGCAGGGGGYGGGAGGTVKCLTSNINPGAGGGSFATGARVSCATAPGTVAQPTKFQTNQRAPDGAVEIWIFTGGC